MGKKKGEPIMDREVYELFMDRIKLEIQLAVSMTTGHGYERGDLRGRLRRTEDALIYHLCVVPAPSARAAREKEDERVELTISNSTISIPLPEAPQPQIQDEDDEYDERVDDLLEDDEEGAEARSS